VKEITSAPHKPSWLKSACKPDSQTTAQASLLFIKPARASLHVFSSWLKLACELT